MNTRLVNTAAGVILRALTQSRTAAGIALALESAQLLQSPETVAETEQLRVKHAEAAATVAQLVLERGERMKVENALRDQIAELEAAQAPTDEYPPALPWAKLMDHEDLTDFLDELAASAITHASSEVALAEVESTCGRWRVIAEAQHAHNTAPGLDAEDDVTPQVAKLRALLADQREQTGGA